MHPLFGAYESRLLRLRRNERTLMNYRWSIRLLESHLAQRGVDAAHVSTLDLEEYLTTLPYALSTQRMMLDNVRSAYRYAVRRGELQRNPATDVELPTLPDREPIVIPTAELRAMQDSITTEREWLFFHLLAYTGMRRKEIKDLRWEDVSLPDRTVKVLGKGGKLRNVPIHPRLGEALADACRHGPYVLHRLRTDTTFQSSRRSFSPGYTAHSFRRTVASSLYANGVPTDTIDKILGWAPREVRSRYYQNIAPVQLHAAILRLYADDPL